MRLRLNSLKEEPWEVRCFPHRTPQVLIACLGSSFTWLCFTSFGSMNLPRSSKRPTPCAHFVLFSGYRLRNLRRLLPSRCVAHQRPCRGCCTRSNNKVSLKARTMFVRERRVVKDRRVSESSRTTKGFAAASFGTRHTTHRRQQTSLLEGLACRTRSLGCRLSGP